MPLGPAAGHPEQIAAHNQCLGAKLRAGVRDHRAVSVRKPPVGNDEIITVRVKIAPSFHPCGGEIDGVPLADQDVHQQRRDIIVVLDQQNAFAGHVSLLQLQMRSAA